MRILILSVKAGAGHMRAAQAIEEALLESAPGVEVKHLESLDLMTSFFRHGFNTVYGSMLKWSPTAWRSLYEHTDRQAPDSRGRAFSAFCTGMNSFRLIREAREYDPDCIICSHFIPAAVMARLRSRGRLRAAVAVVLTDYDIHTMWVHRGVDQYFVPTAEMAHALLRYGVTPGSVSISGIPTLAQFRGKYPQKEQLRRQLGLKSSKPVVLVTGGGCGLGQLDTVVKSLAADYPAAQYLAIAGNNKKTLASLQDIAAESPGTVFPYGFVSNIHEMMAASDLAITKPGGLTCTESLALSLPLILINPIPGQEERNANYLLETGAALYAQNLSSLSYKVRHVLSDPLVLMRMSRAATKAAKPLAALTISEKSLRLARFAAQAPSPLNSRQEAGAAVHIRSSTPAAAIGF